MINSRTLPRRVSLATTLVALAATAVLVAPTTATAGPAQPPQRSRVLSASVAFDVVNTNSTSVACSADNADYVLHGQIVGPRSQVLHGGLDRVNLLVNGLSTGSWLWALPGHAGVNYARHLAARGETSLVLDRLGYGASRLADPSSTCLGAQATMLHQVVQELRAGMYRFTSIHHNVSNAGEVVLQGHAVGAAISEVEAATYHDVKALVLMSWADQQPSTRATGVWMAQMRQCMASDRASFGTTDADYRSLLFASASRAVQSAAVDRRGSAPCGDATSLSQTSVAAASMLRDIDVPVLLLHGSRDALISTSAAQAQRGRYGADADVTYLELAGAGSALPLEHSAPVVRRDVLRWLHSLPVGVLG